MKKIKVLILFVFLSLCASAQSPASGGSNAETDANGDSAKIQFTSPAVADNILQSEEVIIPKDSIDALKNSKDFLYLQNLDSLLRVAQKEKAQEEQPSHDTNWIERFFGSVITRDLFWTIAVCFVLFILYKLFLSEGIFQKRSATIRTNTYEADEDAVHTASDYNIFIEKAIAAKDFRLAVRYLYLLALRQLSDDKLIELAPDKTNFQYLHELKNKEIKNLFGLITYQYECVWYGGFDVNEAAFNAIRNDFKKFTGQL
jgi:uncharacterized protein DUF4129